LYASAVTLAVKLAPALMNAVPVASDAAGLAKLSAVRWMPDTAKP
jgi:hypothetical protein